MDQIFIGRGVGYLGNGATNVVFPITVISLAIALMLGDDGKGYPNGLSGNDIPEVARIIAVADSFDAMYSDRQYRKQMDFDDGHPVFGRAFTGTHSGFSRLFGDRLIGEDLDPDLTAALDVTRHRDTGSFDLVGGDPCGLESDETILTVGDLVAAESFTLHTAALYSSVFDFTVRL